MGTKIIYDLPKPWGRRYSNQKAQAKHRGDEWAFDENTWYKLWMDSGYSEHLGRGVHNYCMVRKDTTEAWGPHNCMIVQRRLHMKKNFWEHILKSPKTDWQDKHAMYVPPEARDAE